MTPRLLIADDHFAIRQGIERLFRDEFPGCAIGFATTYQEVMQQLGSGNWDILLLDLSMPGRGLEVVVEMKDLSPLTRILIYTVHPEDQSGIRCLRAGADGFVTKDRPPEELLAAVNRLLSGRRYISESLAERMAASFGRPEERSVHELLSDRELQILSMLGMGKTATEIADELYLSVKTVSTYRKRVLEKLNLHTTADLIRYAIDQKLC
jgi:two-component system invasion response regulator UvrY